VTATLEVDGARYGLAPEMVEAMVAEAQERVAARRLLAMIGPPPSDGRTRLRNAAAVVVQLKAQEGRVQAELECLDTEAGRALADILASGQALGHLYGLVAAGFGASLSGLTVDLRPRT